MIRAAVFAVVMSLSGVPAVGVVCGLACESDASSSARHFGCSETTTGSSGARLAAAHACDHPTAIHPFVIEAAKGVVAPQTVAATVGNLSGVASDRVPVAERWLDASRGALSPPRVHAPILRI